MIAYVIGIVVVALVFDFINGFHDSANSIATIVGTRVLTPFKAVLWAATFNFRGTLHRRRRPSRRPSAPATSMQNAISANVIAAALLGAIIWNLITWWLAFRPVRRMP